MYRAHPRTSKDIVRVAVGRQQYSARKRRQRGPFRMLAETGRAVARPAGSFPRRR